MRGRIRSIKPELFTDEKLWDLGQETGLPVLQGFTGLWCFADREGRFEWRPRALQALILPFWNGDFADVLDALERKALLLKYEVAGKQYGVVANFLKHQAPNSREVGSTIPPPSMDPRTCTRANPDEAGVTTRANLPSIQNESSGNGILGTERDLGLVELPTAAAPPPPAVTKSPRSKSGSLSALESALRAELGKRGETAPALSKSLGQKAAARVSEHAGRHGMSLDHAAGLLAASWALHGNGNAWKLCDLPFDPRGPRPGLAAARRTAMAPATTDADFADAESLDEQLRRLTEAGR